MEALERNPREADNVAWDVASRLMGYYNHVISDDVHQSTLDVERKVAVEDLRVRYLDKPQRSNRFYIPLGYGPFYYDPKLHDLFIIPGFDGDCIVYDTVQGTRIAYHESEDNPDIWLAANTEFVVTDGRKIVSQGTTPNND